MNSVECLALPRSFYAPSAQIVAPTLLGHTLLRRTPHGICGGEIVETEAYLVDDPACHAYVRETARNRTMWGEAGSAYVFQIYGAYFCLNPVCCASGIAEAVLIRAIRPSVQPEIMRRYREVKKTRDLCSGPGKMCQALDIDRALDGSDLCDANGPLWIAKNIVRDKWVEENGPIITCPRIGLTRAADWPLRFYLDKDENVSRRMAKIRK